MVDVYIYIYISWQSFSLVLKGILLLLNWNPYKLVLSEENTLWEHIFCKILINLSCLPTMCISNSNLIHYFSILVKLFQAEIFYLKSKF